MKTVIEMARESWLDTYGLGKDHISFVEALERFAALVRADEREACAKVCDELAELNRTSPTDSMWEQEECAAAIRARSNT